jgi:hypothetical protein
MESTRIRSANAMSRRIKHILEYLQHLLLSKSVKEGFSELQSGSVTRSVTRSEFAKMFGARVLQSQGWQGDGSALRPGAIIKPLAIPQKRTLAGVGKDRDEAFPFWDQSVSFFQWRLYCIAHPAIVCIVYLTSPQSLSRSGFPRTAMMKIQPL